MIDVISIIISYIPVLVGDVPQECVYSRRLRRQATILTTTDDDDGGDGGWLITRGEIYRGLLFSLPVGRQRSLRRLLLLLLLL